MERISNVFYLVFPFERATPRLEDLSLDDQKKVALKLSDKKDIKKLQKLEVRKQKALMEVSQFNGELSDKDKVDLEVAEKKKSTRPEDFIDPEKWALKMKREKAEIKKLEAIQEAERKRHPQRKSFLDQSPRTSSPLSRVDLLSSENRFELFNKQGKLINVNGICIDLNGNPVFTEVLSKKGVALHINELDIKHINGYQGVIRSENGNLLSMRGPPFREEIRDPEGRLIAINGKRVLDNREDIEYIVHEIEKIANGERKNLKDKVLGKVGVKSARLTIKEAYIKRIHDQCIEAEKALKAEAKRAKKMEAYLKNQEKADKKAQEQESKNRAKILQKELERIEKEKKRELENEAKELKLEEDRKVKNAKLKEEARKIAGIEVSNGDGEASVEVSHEDVCGGVPNPVNPEDFPTTIWKGRPKPDTSDDESGDDEDVQQPQQVTVVESMADKDKREKIKALLEIKLRKKTPENPTESATVDPRTLTLEQMVEADNEAMEEFGDPVKFQNHTERHKERILEVELEMRLTEDEMKELKRRQEEQIKKKKEEEEDIRKEKDEFNRLVNGATDSDIAGPSSDDLPDAQKKEKDISLGKNEIAMAKQFLKHQEKMEKLEQSFRKKNETRMEKITEKEHLKKLAEIKSKDKEHEKEMLKRTKDLKMQEKQAVKDWKEKDKQHKSLEKKQAKELKKKQAELKRGKEQLRKEQERIKKEELSVKKDQQKEDKERLKNAKEIQKQEDKDAKSREKMIAELQKIQEKKLEKDKLSSEKENKLLDKKLQRENKEKLEEIKLKQKQEEREMKMREKEIAELEKLQQKQASKELDRVRREHKLQEKMEDQQAKMRVREMKDIQNANNREVKDRAKQIEQMEKDQAKNAAKELEKLQKLGKVEEKKAAKEAKLQLKKMKDEQAKADRELKRKVKEMEKLEKEQEKLAEKEVANLKKEEQEQAKKEKKEMSEKLKQMKVDMKKQEKEAENKLKEIEKIEREQDKEALKEMESLKKEGKIQEKRMEKEVKDRLKKLRNDQKLQETENKRQQKEIEKLEQEECKKAEKELERIKKEGKYRESQEAKETKLRLKKLKEDQKKKDKENDKRQKERAALEKMENEILIQQALLLTDVEKMKRLDETLASCKSAVESKEKLGQEAKDLIEQEIDSGAKVELREVSGEMDKIEEEKKVLEEDKENLKNEEEFLENQEQELQIKTEIFVDDLPLEWKNKIANIKQQQAKADETTRGIKEKLAEMKRSHESKMNEVDKIEGEVEQLLQGNISPDNMEKINKYRAKKEEIQKKIEEARQQFSGQKTHLEELTSQEQDLKDQEEEVLHNESANLKDLMEVKMDKAEHEHNAQQMENELDILMVENKAVSQEIHQVAAREEVLLSYEPTSDIEVQLTSVRNEGTKAKAVYEDTIAKIQSIKEAIEREYRQKKAIELKEKEIIESKVTDEGKSKLMKIGLQLKKVNEDKQDVKNLMDVNKENEHVCQKQLIDAEKDEEKNLYKDLNKEAKKEFQILKNLQKKEQKEVRKKEKDLAKAKKMQEKSRREKEVLQKKEMKILEKEAAKEMKDKIKELKREKKEQEKATKKKEKDGKALVQKEIKMRKKEKALKAKEEKILEKSLKKETAAKVKELKKAQKEKDKEAKRLAKEAKVLQKAKEKEEKQIGKGQGKSKGKNKADKLSKLQMLQEEYEKLKASREREVEELEGIVHDQDDEIVKVEKEIEVIQENEAEDDDDFVVLKKSKSEDSIVGVKSLDNFEVESSDDEDENDEEEMSEDEEEMSEDEEEMSGDEEVTTSEESKSKNNKNKNTKKDNKAAKKEMKRLEKEQKKQLKEMKKEAKKEYKELEKEAKKEKKELAKDAKKEKKELAKEAKKEKKELAKEAKKDKKQTVKDAKKEKEQTVKDAKKEKKVTEKDIRKEQKDIEKDADTEEKLQKMKEKHAKDIQKEVEKHQKELRKRIEKEQKKQMKLEKKKLKQGMKKQIKEPVTTDLVGVLGQEVLKVLTLGGGGVTGEGNQETLINPMNFVEDPENKGQDVIKELCRNVLLQKIEKFDNENLVLKNEIKTLRFALEACQEKNDVQSGDYEEQIRLADSEIAELEGYRDNAEMLVKQVNAMHQQLHYMIKPSEYEKMEARVNMLNRRILKFKCQRDCLLVEKNELGEQTDQLKFQLRLERQHKANSEERMQNEARLCNNYRDKFLALEKKFDAYTKRTIQEQRRILFEYGYQVKDNAFQDKSLTVQDLKDRIVKLELVVKEKDDQLMQISSVERKEENARSLLDEVQIQMNRMTEANTLYHEEEKLLQKEYEVQAERALNNRINELNMARQAPSKEAYRECNKLKKQIKNLQNEKKGLQVLVDEKDHTLKVMAMNQGHICTPDGRDRSKCEHCKEGTHVVSERIRKKLMFPFRHGESHYQHHHKHSIKSQIVVNPDAKIPTVSQKQREEYEAFVKKKKRQLFRIQEAERAAKILFKEIQDRFSEKDQQKGKSMVEQLATTLLEMMTDLKDFTSDNNNIVVDDDSDVESSQGI